MPSEKPPQGGGRLNPAPITWRDRSESFGTGQGIPPFLQLSASYPREQPCMDPAYAKKKIVDLSDAELHAFGFLGENVPPDVKRIIGDLKANPDSPLNFLTCFTLECVKRTSNRVPPASPTISEAESRYLELINDPDARMVIAPDLISKYEMTFYYHRISGDPPWLMWRSDFETNPFPIPPPGTEFSMIPTKTIHGIFNTPLKEVWHDIAPRIMAAMKDRGLKCSSLQGVRFSTHEDGKDKGTLGPVVVWVSVRPDTTTLAEVRDATADILRILADVQITDVVVEWIEASIVRMIDEVPSS